MSSPRGACDELKVHPVLDHMLVLLCRASWCLRLYHFRFVPSNKVKWVKVTLCILLCTHTKHTTEQYWLLEVLNFIFAVVNDDTGDKERTKPGGRWRMPESLVFVIVSFVQSLRLTDDCLKACRHINISAKSSICWHFRS